jgi:hypothetical protein
MLSITTKVTVPGYHHWAGAPDNAQNFLKNIHRHLFTFEAEVQVTGSRQVEFFELQERMRYILERVGYFNGLLVSRHGTSMSCEQMAETMARALYNQHGHMVLKVSVSEDGESSGTWTRDRYE